MGPAQYSPLYMMMMGVDDDDEDDDGDEPPREVVQMMRSVHDDATKTHGRVYTVGRPL